MLKFLKKEANMTYTENGAATYRSTQSECLDLFATIGALRRESDEEITNRFLRCLLYTSGRYELEGGTLIVSRGLARESTRVPRVFNRPELVIIDVTPAC